MYIDVINDTDCQYLCVGGQASMKRRLLQRIEEPQGLPLAAVWLCPLQ
jgi:hypothetical protein